MAVDDVGDEHADVDPLGPRRDRRQGHEGARPRRALHESAEVVVRPHGVEAPCIGGPRRRRGSLRGRGGAGGARVGLGRWWGERGGRGRRPPPQPLPLTTVGEQIDRAVERAFPAARRAGAREDPRPGQADRPRAHRPAARPAVVRRGRRARQQPWPTGAAGRRRGHRAGHDRRDAGRRRRQRPDGQGRLVGRPHGREDGPGLGGGARRAGADRLAGRLGGRPPHRPGPAVPRRRGAGRIFYNQVRLSGQVPQICCLFGPSAAGGAYIPSFCDVVFMVDGNASMYLGSPRMAEMVVGEITTLEEMGGAGMHVTQSGCADNLAHDDTDAIDQARPTSPTSRGRGATSRRCTRASRRRSSCPTTSCRPTSASRSTCTP